VNQLICLAKQHKADDVGDFIYQTLEQAGQRLVKENNALETREDTMAGLAESLVIFERDVAPVLTRLGIR
jgi:hypothetical protein